MFGKASERPRRQVDSENPYWVSFSDIMAALLAIFALAVVDLVIQLHERRAEVEDAIQALEHAFKVRKHILYSVKDRLEREYDIVVEITDNESVLRIPDKQFHFASGSAKIPPELQENIGHIGSVLYEEMAREGRLQFLDTVFIEGHTDSVRWHGEHGNWGLSVERANEVWKYWWTEVEPRYLALNNAAGEPLFSVSGYADTRRVELADDTPEKREKNRRIDIRFTVHQPKLTKYGETLKLFGGLLPQGVPTPIQSGSGEELDDEGL